MRRSSLPAMTLGRARKQYSQNIQKNRCQTTVAEPIWGNTSGTAPYRASGRLFRPRPGRLERTCHPALHSFHTCNTWTAEALRAVGLPVNAAGVVFAGQVLDQLPPLAEAPEQIQSGR